LFVKVVYIVVKLFKKWWGWVKKNEFCVEKAKKKVRGSATALYL